MLERILDPIFAPFRLLRSKVFQVKALPNTVKGEVSRAKNEVNIIRGDAKSYAASAKGAGAKAQGAAAQAKTAKAGGDTSRSAGKKMGWFSRKKKCEGCGQKLHPSWQECPYCGFGKSATSMGAVPAGGSPQRTMALEVGSAAPAGTGMIGWFIPLEGEKAGELFPLRGRISVGTSPDNDIVIAEASISGHHCEFVGGAAGFKLNDLGSTNGTFVNDKRIQTHDLVDNDNVMLGRVRFKFKSLV